MKPEKAIGQDPIRQSSKIILPQFGLIQIDDSLWYLRSFIPHSGSLFALRETRSRKLSILDLTPNQCFSLKKTLLLHKNADAFFS